MAGDIGELAQDGLEAAGDLAEDVGELAGDGLDAAGDLAEDVGELAGDGLDAAGGAAEDIAEGLGDGLDEAREMADDAAEGIEDAVGGEDGDGEADDVDMYAGAGPMDLDDEGPTGGGNFAKVFGCAELRGRYLVGHEPNIHKICLQCQALAKF